MRQRRVALLSSVATAVLMFTGFAAAQGEKSSPMPQARSQQQSETKGASSPDRAVKGEARPQNPAAEKSQRSAAEKKGDSPRETTGTDSPRGTTGKAMSDDMRRQKAEPGQKSESRQPSRAATDDDNRRRPDADNPASPSRASKQDRTGQKGVKSRSGTTGQATKDEPHGQGPAQKAPRGDPAAEAPATPRESVGRNAQQPSSPSQRQTGTAAQAQDVQLSTEQQSRIQQTVMSVRNAPRVDRVDFALRVGTTVPAHIHAVAVPPTFIEIHPEWRGHEYFVVRDEIVIVDDSRRVVAVIPASSRRAGTTTRGGDADVIEVADLTPEQIREIQVVLIEKQFLDGSPDGVFGPRTRQALVEFQRREGIQVSGRIDNRTISSLGLSEKIRTGGASTVGQGSDQRSGDRMNRRSEDQMNRGANGQRDRTKTGAQPMPRPNQQSTTPLRSTTGQGTTGQGTRPGADSNPDGNARPNADMQRHDQPSMSTPKSDMQTPNAGDRSKASPK